MSETRHTRSPEETRRLGAKLAKRVGSSAVLLLYGEMGAGKTVLTQGIGMGLGLAAEEIQSPTFTLIREHRGERGALIHVDLYRLEPEEAAELGLEEVLARPALKVIEWAERLPFPVPEGIVVRLERLESGEHRIELEE